MQFVMYILICEKWYISSKIIYKKISDTICKEIIEIGCVCGEKTKRRRKHKTYGLYLHQNICENPYLE